MKKQIVEESCQPKQAPLIITKLPIKTSTDENHKVANQNKH